MDWPRFDGAIALRDSGKDEAALAELEILARSKSDVKEQGSIIANQATCLWRLGRLEEARERLSEAERLWTNIYTEFTDACLCSREGKSEEALLKLTSFLTKYPDLSGSSDGYLYLNAQEELGQVLFNLGRYGDAIEPLRQGYAAALGDQRFRIGRYLGVCYFELEKWEQALETIREQLPSDDRGFWWHDGQYYLGVCYFKMGMLEKAEQALIRSLSLDKGAPLWGDAQYQLGCVYFRRGAYAKAKEAFEICELFAKGSERKENISKWHAAIRAKQGTGKREAII